MLECDVCVVGGGPIGLTIASELAGTGLRVDILESGGLEISQATEALNAVECVGPSPIGDQALARHRGLGGSSHAWAGRVAAFDELDFEARDWVALSGWPITYAEYRSYLPHTLAHLGAHVADNTDRDLRAKVLSRPFRDLCSRDLDCYIWSYSQDAVLKNEFLRFGPRAARSVLPGVRAVLNATVTHIDTTESGSQVRRLEVMGSDGGLRYARPRAVVLCAGGIENARLLLASNRVVRVGVGNGRDQVGRYLMDHPRASLGTFDPRQGRAIMRLFGSYRPRIGDRHVVVTPGLALSREAQRAGRLLNCAGWVDVSVAENDPFEVIKRVRRHRWINAGEAWVLARHSGRILCGALRVLRGRSPIRQYHSVKLECAMEQPPRADSRVTLSSALDRLGTPRARVCWQVGAAENETARVFARAVVSSLQRHDLPRPRLAAEVEDPQGSIRFRDNAHPMGTTRMSADPATGVVDTDCAVHGVDGLYVAGTSVFPTAGHANPTQTALALAIRLADHLRNRLRS
jgi:choline dehydrogenase-like flavoprotein